MGHLSYSENNFLIMNAAVVFDANILFIAHSKFRIFFLFQLFLFY